MQVLSDHPDVERVCPMALRVQHAQRHGKVYRRRIVVDGWEEVPTEQ